MLIVAISDVQSAGVKYMVILKPSIYMATPWFAGWRWSYWFSTQQLMANYNMFFSYFVHAIVKQLYLFLCDEVCGASSSILHNYTNPSYHVEVVSSVDVDVVT